MRKDKIDKWEKTLIVHKSGKNKSFQANFSSANNIIFC